MIPNSRRQRSVLSRRLIAAWALVHFEAQRYLKMHSSDCKTDTNLSSKCQRKALTNQYFSTSRNFPESPVPVPVSDSNNTYPSCLKCAATALAISSCVAVNAGNAFLTCNSSSAVRTGGGVDLNFCMMGIVYGVRPACVSKAEWFDIKTDACSRLELRLGNGWC